MAVNWASLNKTSGSGSQQVIITVAENKDEVTKSCRVKALTSKGVEDYHEVTVAAATVTYEIYLKYYSSSAFTTEVTGTPAFYAGGNSKNSSDGYLYVKAFSKKIVNSKVVSDTAMLCSDFVVDNAGDFDVVEVDTNDYFKLKFKSREAITGVEKTASIIVRRTINGMSYSASGSFTQDKNVVTAMQVRTELSYGTIIPSGGSVSPTLVLRYKPTFSSGYTPTSWSTSWNSYGLKDTNITVSYSMSTKEGFILNTTTGAITATSMGTTLGSRESNEVSANATGTVNLTDELGGTSVTITPLVHSKGVATQGTNTVVSREILLGTPLVQDIPAKGGDSLVTWSVPNKLKFTYSSGATSSDTTSGITVATSPSKITGYNLGTTVKERTLLGTLQLTVSASGATSKVTSVDVYQAANNYIASNYRIKNLVLLNEDDMVPPEAAVQGKFVPVADLVFDSEASTNEYHFNNNDVVWSCLLDGSPLTLNTGTLEFAQIPFTENTTLVTRTAVLKCSWKAGGGQATFDVVQEPKHYTKFWKAEEVTGIALNNAEYFDWTTAPHPVRFWGTKLFDIDKPHFLKCFALRVSTTEKTISITGLPLGNFKVVTGKGTFTTGSTFDVQTERLSEVNVDVFIQIPYGFGANIITIKGTSSFDNTISEGFKILGEALPTSDSFSPVQVTNPVSMMELPASKQFIETVICRAASHWEFSDIEVPSALKLYVAYNDDTDYQLTTFDNSAELLTTGQFQEVRFKFVYTGTDPFYSEETKLFLSNVANLFQMSFGDFLEVHPTEIQVDAAGGTATITIKTNRSWTITEI